MSRKKCDTPMITGASEVIRVIENFLPEEAAVALRDLALSREFINVEHAGHLYPSVHVCSPNVDDAMKVPLQNVTGGEVDIITSFFRLSGEDVHTGDGSEFRVHWDSAMGDYTAILYLNENADSMGGTAFWKHIPSGWTSVESSSGMPEAAFEQLCADSRDGMAWELHSLVGSQWNRLGIYRSDLIHSQWPLQGWGSTKETSRLVWVCFFDMPPEG